MKTQKKVEAVLISDLHYRVDTLHLADAALRQAIDEARDLGCPVYILGDLNDTKAIIRGEVMNALLSTMDYASNLAVPIKIVVGNHDLINERSIQHTLYFLASMEVSIVHGAEYHSWQKIGFINYQSTPEAFAEKLKMMAPGSTLFIHQGVMGANLGSYVVDHSAIDPEILKDYRVFSGHYHQHQTVGTITYLGSPYSITAAEAQDGPKGFLVLYNDGSFKQVPTHLRKHVTVERTIYDVYEDITDLNPQDLLWMKVSGPYSELENLNKQLIGKAHLGHSNFKLDKIVTESGKVGDVPNPTADTHTNQELMDSLIDQSTESDKQKALLKRLWRQIA